MFYAYRELVKSLEEKARQDRENRARQRLTVQHQTNVSARRRRRR
jgi:hypothetical protein